MAINYGQIDYSVINTPTDYVCSCCGAKGIKLWREYCTFLNHVELFCAPCAAKNQDIEIHHMDEKGSYILPTTLQRTDQIGWFVPAIPTEEGDSFWGYTSVPPDGCNWWRSLPLK